MKTFELILILLACVIVSAPLDQVLKRIALPLVQVEFVDMVYYVTWALAKNADPEIPEPKKWVKQFDTFYLDEIVPEVYGMILKGFASSKNLQRLEEIKQTLMKAIQPSL